MTAKDEKKKNKSVLLYAGSIGIVLFSLAEVYVFSTTPEKLAMVIPFGILMVLAMVLFVKGFCDFISSKLNEIVSEKIEGMNKALDVSPEELMKINKATFMRVKKLNADMKEVLERSGMSKAEMEECNRLLSDEIAKRQMCIANIQIKRNVENTDALLNSNDKILGQFNQITRIVQKSALEAEISQKENASLEPEIKETPEEISALIPEDSIEIIVDDDPVEEVSTPVENDPNKQMTAEEIAALFDSL